MKKTLVLKAALAVLLCWNAPAWSAPNVLLLSIDALRADHLGCYGYERKTSPVIDKFAESSLLFEDCFCEVPLTFPSFGAMMTSRFPRETGATRNGLRIPDRFPTVAESFQKAGYHTFCVQSNWTLKGKLSHINRGFDQYNDDFHQKRWGFFSSERLGGDVTECALRALAERPKDKPFFAWVHYSDPHAPYEMHDEYDVWGKRDWHAPQADRIRKRYDSEIGFTDACIAKLLAALPEDTLIVLTADHGESLYEHNYLGHGRRIYQDNLHIPLIIHAPQVAAGRTKAPARGIDIGPTLLGLAGLPKAPGMEGLDLSRETPPMSRVRVVEAYGGAVFKIPVAKSLMTEAKPIHQAIIDGEWKLILSGRRMQLYHLQEDPGELHEYTAHNPAKAHALLDTLRQWDHSVVRGQKERAKLTAQDVWVLGSMGYLQ